MEIKYNIKDHILYLCEKCGAMKIVDRLDSDIKNSVFVAIDCPLCEEFKKGYPMLYYGRNGFLGDEEDKLRTEMELLRVGTYTLNKETSYEVFRRMDEALDEQIFNKTF